MVLCRVRVRGACGVFLALNIWMVSVKVRELMQQSVTATVLCSVFVLPLALALVGLLVYLIGEGYWNGKKARQALSMAFLRRLV